MKQKFSDRIGVTKPNNVIQIDSLTRELRNQLWNSFDLFYLLDSRKNSDRTALADSYLNNMAMNVWMYYLKNTIDTIPYYEKEFINGIRQYVLTKDWFEVYNILDFCLAFADITGIDKKKYIDVTNELLKEELSGYRIIDGCFAPITNEEQLKSISELLELAKDKGLNGVYSHISAAIQLLSTKEINKMDKYRNSIKESISAVEALCNKLNNKKSDGLKGALSKLKTKVKIHGALEEGFIRLYGYTSDSDGIRHTIMDEPDLDVEDAVYMLVTCSAFVHYLIQKSIKANLI